MSYALRTPLLSLLAGLVASGAAHVPQQQRTPDPPAGGATSQEVPPADGAPVDGAARAELVAAMAQAGIRLDLDLGVVSIPATVQMRSDQLEFLLCTPRGQVHESLFLTEVSPTVLNAALLALGVEPGRNARLIAQDLALDEGEVDQRGGVAPGELSAAAAAGHPEVQAPEGDGFYLYVAWREGEELYFFRVDDLIANFASGRSLRRHRWVYLGSRIVRAPSRAGEEAPREAFAAELEGNLINISFFFGGNTLVTASLPECIEQTVWAGNAWLLPPSSSPIEFFFSRKPLERVPAPWRETLPVVKRDPAGPEGGR